MKSLNKKNFARGACLFSAMLCSMAVTPAMAERHHATRLQTTQEQITGTILDAQSGQPVAGAQITVKGTRITAISDDNGRFTINAKAGAELTISLIGYERQTVRAAEGMKIALKDIGNELGEAVIVGYATQKKANLTGSVAQIKTEELEARPVQNVSSALQGLMPGVSITSGQGRPGQDGSTIRVRGVGTLNNSDPYILVDGVETGTINQIDPNDIESISVLKDAASAAIYGSKASNGVILITTKRGKIGKPVFTYNGNVGILSPTKLVDRISSAEYAEMLNFALTENGKRARFTEEEIAKFRDGSDPDNYPNTDWYDLAFETGIQHSHSFNVSGGTELVKYMASAGYMNQQGILPSSARERFNARANLDFQFTSRLNGRVGINFIKNDYQDPSSNYAGGSSDQIIRQLNIIAPWIAARKSDGTYGTISDGNPIAWLDADQPVKRDNQTTTVNLGLDYKILEGLVATANVSHLNANQRYKYFEKYFRYNPNKETSPNNLTEVAYNWTRTGLDLLLNYTKQFGDHGLKLLGGYHAEKYDYSQLSGYRKNFPNNNVTDMNGGDASTGTNGGYSRELNMMSWFGRVNYDYKGRYLFEANLRADASSRFAKGHRWGYFPSFSAAWRISEEDFMQSSRDWLSYLKLRASWGQLGNQDALSEYYPALNTYNLGAIAVFGGTPTPGYYQSNYKMTTISWEKARTWGFGLDFTLFNKVTGSLDYYDRKTTGIIMQVPAPYEFALGSYNDNVGAMSNRGVELSLGYNDRWGDWSFGVQANVSYNKNKILNLGGVTTMSDPNNGNMRREVGKAINSYLCTMPTASLLPMRRHRLGWISIRGRRAILSVRTNSVRATSSTSIRTTTER